MQLAALITFADRADRAERAGARFEWGMLHDPDSALYPAVTAESALRLIEGRTAAVLGEDTLRAWSIRARKSGWEDVWIVGRSARPRLPGAAWEPASIEAHDVLGPDRRAVRVTVSLPSSPPRVIDLDLPDEPACARLLRNPFKRPPSPPRAGVDAVVTSNLIFAENGTKLFARGRGGEVLAYPVPSASHGSPGRPERYMPKSRGVVVAVGWMSRVLVMLIADKHELRFESTNGKILTNLRLPIPLPEELGFAAPTLDDPLALLVFKSHGPRLVPITTDAPALALRPVSAVSRAIFGVAIGLSPSALTSSMFAAGDFFDKLRAAYRKAFEQLEREGRIDEAAFVLAELLHVDEEAVAFLERHGRLRLAAEVAEARDLPPGLIVRQWFLAGDVARWPASRGASAPSRMRWPASRSTRASLSCGCSGPTRSRPPATTRPPSMSSGRSPRAGASALRGSTR